MTKQNAISSTVPFIVITSIFPPTEAVEKYAAINGHRLVVVGDKKSPSVWDCPNTVFLSVDEQNSLSYHLLNKLPYNHYSRKMIGYIFAIKSGASMIIDTDDDNIPLNNWEFPEFIGKHDTTMPDSGFVNMYKSFSAMKIWPRGFPLELINDPNAVIQEDGLTEKKVRVGVWQALADGDPDVDAIYRITNNTPCYFDQRKPIVLDKGTVCPFNSQNTAFHKQCFALLYLPVTVTFRFTDILRGLVAQPIMWKAGYRLGFTQATVEQKRNPHDYLNDFQSEIPCFLHVRKVIQTVSDVVRSNESIPDNLRRAYEALANEGIVEPQEVELLDLWLQDIVD